MSVQQQQNPPKRPRLSLQIKAISSGPNLRASRTIAAVVNPTSPTSFNTLSNVYATAIDRATPVTAINTKQSLKLETQNLDQNQNGAQTPYASTLFPETPLTAQPISPAVAGLQDFRFPSTMTATPPLSAGTVENDTKPFSFSKADTAPTTTPSAVTSIPAPNFTVASPSTSTTPRTMRRRATAPLNNASLLPLPYVRNRSLHSILRNSPLPPPTAKTPTSPRRQSLRLAEKAARRVGYESPIERVITTNEYVRSHVDLLMAEDQQLSPSSMSPTSTLDDIMMTGNETSGTRDGGQTPGPFEEMRRRMAGLVTRTPTSPSCTSAGSSPAGIRKRRRKDRGRRWVWTIGTQEDEDEEDDKEVGGAIAATRAAASRAQRASYPSDYLPSAAAVAATAVAMTPPAPPPLQVDNTIPSPMEILTPSIETFDEAESSVPTAHSADDVVMSESEAETETDVETPSHTGQGGRMAVHSRKAVGLVTTMDIDTMITPTVARRPGKHIANFLDLARRSRSVTQESDGLFNSETGSRRDTPIPADLVPASQQ